MADKTDRPEITYSPSQVREMLRFRKELSHCVEAVCVKNNYHRMKDVITRAESAIPGGCRDQPEYAADVEKVRKKVEIYRASPH